MTNYKSQGEDDILEAIKLQSKMLAVVTDGINKLVENERDKADMRIMELEDEKKRLEANLSPETQGEKDRNKQAVKQLAEELGEPQPKEDCPHCEGKGVCMVRVGDDEWDKDVCSCYEA